MYPVERHGSTGDDAVLDLLRDVEPSTAGTVDVQRAIRGGRRRVRGRQVAASAAAVATALAIVVPSLPWTRPAPAVAPASEIASDGKAFDLGTAAFVVGSAGGFAPDTYETGRYRQIITLRSADPARRATAVITMYAAGHQPSLPTGDPAPAVNGSPARWTSSGVAWEWAPGAWGIVAMGDMGDMGEDRLRAHRIAQSVLPRRGVPVSVPFTVDPEVLGAGRHLIGVVTSYPYEQAAPARASLKYAAHDLSTDWVEVGVRRPRPSTTPNAEIRGTPAVMSGTEVVLLPAGKDFAIFASGGDETTRRALATAVTLVQEPVTPR
ncbi:hypothetical protein [Nonomuraea jabiensis]|uniref:hypothetical protein n=1 Tax=Nonomuraea jabiensis TaxID=882448 RepID=UPI003D755C83